MTAEHENVNAPRNGGAFKSDYARYVALGYTSALPIGEGTKRPAAGLKGWPDLADHPADAATLASWAVIPGAGIGAVMGAAAGADADGTPLVLVALDDDREAPPASDALGDALAALLAGSPRKVGKRGGTYMLRMRADEAHGLDYAGVADTRDCRDLVQLLGHGRQTVLPPTLHPETGQPYIWTAALVPAGELPIVRRADLDAALAAHGYRSGSTRPAAADGARYERAAADIAAGEVRDGIVALLEIEGGRLSELWEHGAEAQYMHTPTKGGGTRDTSGSGLRLELARQMGRQGYNPAEQAAALREWDHAEGRHGVTERDICRAVADGTEASTGDNFTAVVDDERMFSAKLIARVGLRGLDEPRLPRPKWIFEGAMPDGRLGLIVGQTRAGKSFIAMGAAGALATGQDFLGYKINGGCRGVVYFASEALDTVEERMDALAVAGLADSAMPFLYSGLADAAALDDALSLAAYTMEQRYGVKLGVVFVDTFAVMFRPKDENANGEVGEIMAGCLGLAAKHGVMIVLVHHTGKGAGAGARGASNFTGMADWQWTVLGGTNEETGIASDRTLALAKARRGQTGPLTGFDLRTVEVGTDAETGKPILAAYALPVVQQSAAIKRPAHHGAILAALAGGGMVRAELQEKVAAAAAVSPNAVQKAVAALLNAGKLVAGEGKVVSLAPDTGTAFLPVVDGDAEILARGLLH